MLRKLGAPDIAGIRHGGALVLYCGDLARRPRLQFRQREVTLITGFDGRFDQFWELTRQRRDRLLAVRSREALMWQFGLALESGKLAIFGISEGNSLLGYLIMKRFDQEGVGLRRFRVVDIQVLGDEPDSVLSLMTAALNHAKLHGVDVVEAMGFHESKRSVLEQLNPRHRAVPSCPFFYLVSEDSRPLQQSLKETDAWDPSPFDGDAAL
jgi:hypothetical protein